MFLSHGFQFFVLIFIGLILCVLVFTMFYFKLKVLSSYKLQGKPLLSNISVVFVSFAGGDKVHYANQNDQKNTNKKFIPNLVAAYYETEHTLRLTDYFTKLSPELKQSSRGYHYWSWKPYIILKAMLAHPSDVVIFYLDSGAKLKRNVKPLIYTAKTYGRVLFSNFHDNSAYCKCEPIVTYLPDVHTQKKFIKSLQLDAACLVFTNSKDNKAFVADWLNKCFTYNLVSDSPSTLCTESVSFVDHRHDQALLSLVAFSHSTEGQYIAGIHKKFWFVNHHRRRSI